MRIQSITDKSVTAAATKVMVSEVCSADTDEEVIAFAMRAAGESRSSLFGWHITRYPDDYAALVRLDTD